MPNSRNQIRLIQLLGMLGSHHDGEILNAAKLAQRQLGAMGLTWEEFIQGSAGEPAGPSKEDLAYAYQRGYRDGAEDTRKASLPQQPPSWQSLARLIRDNHERNVTDWEYGFVESFIERGWPTPTEKQRKIFQRIAVKLDLICPD